MNQVDIKTTEDASPQKQFFQKPPYGDRPLLKAPQTNKNTNSHAPINNKKMHTIVANKIENSAHHKNLTLFFRQKKAAPIIVRLFQIKKRLKNSNASSLRHAFVYANMRKRQIQNTICH